MLSLVKMLEKERELNKAKEIELEKNNSQVLTKE